MTEQIHEALLSPSGMASARDSLCEEWQWFGHAAPLKSFESIKRKGLEPSKPRTAKVPAEVLTALGPEAEKIICLSTLPMSIPLVLTRVAAYFWSRFQKGTSPL
ncbi:MAG: hypothetical protein R3D01_09665 [Hyphomicrobiales bacterium]